MSTIDSTDVARAILEDREHRIMKAAVPAPRTRKAVWNDAIRKLVSLGKSFPGDEVDDFIDFDSEIADGINANYLNRVPGRQEIPLSPTTSASGAGAERLPKWSSDHAPQGGITELYNKFNALMAEFAELKKCQSELLDSVLNLAKATKKAFPDSENEDEDSDEDDDETKVEKALAGLGMRTGGIRDVINAMRSADELKMPPSFIKSTLAKVDTDALMETLTTEQAIQFQSARNCLSLAAQGVETNSDRIAHAMRIVENPSGGVLNMGHFRVKPEHQDPDAPVALITAFRVRPHQCHMYKPLLHLGTGTVRMPADGDWIVSQPNEEPVVMQHENFLSNYEQADR